jgi:hypothetical protein
VQVRLLLRDRRALAGLAFLVIFVGALLGLALKWLTETATDLGRYRREHRRLSRRFPRGLAPSWVSQALDQAADLIQDGETSRIDEALKPVRDRSEEIDNFRREYELTLKRVDLVEELAPPGLTGQVLDLRRRLEALRERATQDHGTNGDSDDFTKLQGALATIEDQAKQGPSPSTGEQADDSEDGGAWWNPAQRKSPRHLRRPQEAEEPSAPVRLVEFLSDHVRPTLAFMSALVVAVAGIQIEVINDPGFSGSMSDFVGLAMWALAVEFTGVSLTEVIGKIQPQS